MLLCDFPREVLSGITAWLNGASIANLWYCGSEHLISNFRKEVLKFGRKSRLNSSDAFVFPRLVLNLHGLRTLSIISNSFKNSINLLLAKLPKSLEELSLSIALSTKSFLLEKDTSCDSLDFTKQFPKMRKLRLSCNLSTLPNWIPSMQLLKLCT